MKRLIAFGIFLNAALVGARAWQEAAAQVQPTPAGNGDVNGDGDIDISDASHLLNWLFLGGPQPIPCPPNNVATNLPATGQTECYDEFGEVIDCLSDTCPGQDAFYQIGCSKEGRFTDNGDGTVTDNCTGLMWQKDLADLDGDGEFTFGRPDFVLWCEALEYCENLEYAGYGDWRLPSITELLSIVDYVGARRIQPVFGDIGWHLPLWSSTTVPQSPRDAWVVDFSDGVAFKEGEKRGLPPDDRPVPLRAVRTVQ